LARFRWTEGFTENLKLLAVNEIAHCVYPTGLGDATFMRIYPSVGGSSVDEILLSRKGSVLLPPLAGSGEFARAISLSKPLAAVIVPALPKSGSLAELIKPSLGSLPVLVPFVPNAVGFASREMRLRFLATVIVPLDPSPVQLPVKVFELVGKNSVGMPAPPDALLESVFAMPFLALPAVGVPGYAKTVSEVIMISLARVRQSPEGDAIASFVMVAHFGIVRLHHETATGHHLRSVGFPPSVPSLGRYYPPVLEPVKRLDLSVGMSLLGPAVVRAVLRRVEQVGRLLSLFASHLQFLEDDGRVEIEILLETIGRRLDLVPEYERPSGDGNVFGNRLARQEPRNKT